MASIGRQLFIAEYYRQQNLSVIYYNITTNPFDKQFPAVLASGPGHLKSILVYHKTLVQGGRLQCALRDFQFNTSKRMK